MAPEGTIYASQLLHGGLVKVSPDPERPGRFLPPQVLYGGELASPTGIAVGPDGWIYVSVDAVFTDDVPVLHGRVVRVRG